MKKPTEDESVIDIEVDSTDTQSLKKTDEDFLATKETLEIFDKLIIIKEPITETIFLEIIEIIRDEKK